MAVVLFIGLGFAALRSASPLLASAVFTLTVAILSAAVLGAMARRGRARMIWAGFALFGWIYLGTTFGPWEAGNGVTAPPYVTRWALDYWDAKLWSVGPVQIGRMETGPSGEMLFPRYPPVVLPPSLPPDAFQFRRIGHCCVTILFGVAGAVLGRLLAVKGEGPNP
jgi:hypothetical protein